jgi:hypothetical protein
MSTRKLTIEMPLEAFSSLKMICIQKNLSVNDFVKPLILKALDKEENSLLRKKANRRLKNMNSNHLIPIEKAFEEAGWNIK